MGISAVCMVLVAKLSLEYRKTRVLLGSYLLLQNLEKAQGLTLDQHNSNEVNKVICHDPQVSIILTILSVLGTILIIIHQCKNGKFCRE